MFQGRVVDGVYDFTGMCEVAPEILEALGFRVAGIENEIAVIKGKIDVMDGRVSDLEVTADGTLTVLTNTGNAINDRVDHLEVTVTALNGCVQNRLNVHEGRIKALQDQNAAQREEIKALKDENKALKDGQVALEGRVEANEVHIRVANRCLQTLRVTNIGFLMAAVVAVVGCGADATAMLNNGMDYVVKKVGEKMHALMSDLPTVSSCRIAAGF